jgi:hypothetical protein
LADALHDATMDLALDDHWVQHHADIVDCGVGDESQLSGIRVDLDLGRSRLHCGIDLAQKNHGSRCDPALIKAIVRGRAWFEELATGRARSLQELAKRDGISRRYIRRLVNLAFLSPQLVQAILQGRQPVELTATRLTELDLPLDWTEQRRLLAS